MQLPTQFDSKDSTSLLFHKDNEGFFFPEVFSSDSKTTLISLSCMCVGIVMVTGDVKLFTELDSSIHLSIYPSNILPDLYLKGVAEVCWIPSQHT